MADRKGTCVTNENANPLRRSKYASKLSCQRALDSHIMLGVVPDTHIIYKCKVCKMWHFGKSEWAKQYGMKSKE